MVALTVPLHNPLHTYMWFPGPLFLRILTEPKLKNTQNQLARERKENKRKNTHREKPGKMSQYPGSERPTSMSQKSRQKPGAACEECRRRKLRCDRRQPRCGHCQSSGVACLLSESHPSKKGPKRGYLSSLQSRISRFEVLPYPSSLFTPLVLSNTWQTIWKTNLALGKPLGKPYT